MAKKKEDKKLTKDQAEKKIITLKKDLFNIYENELHPKNIEENEGIKDYTQFDGINDDWEEFNERDFSSKKGG